MLTERQKAFVSAYAGPGTGLAAARAAGYTGADATLRVAASRLLRVPAVMAALEDRLALPASTTTPAGKAAPAKLAAPKPPKDDPRIAGAVEQQRILTSIARSDEESSEVRIKAVVALAKIQTAPPAAKAPHPLATAGAGTTVRAVFRVTHDEPQTIDATPTEAKRG